MIARLALTGFMAHADTVLDLAPGLNVLTGPNNTGKSAVVEALRCLSQNPVPRHVIRHGAAEARVTVTLADGTVVTWVRRPKYALYELTRPKAAEPEVFAKFGRTPPEEILDVLRLDPVPLEVGEPVDVHLGDQRQPIFLLNQPGTVVAGFFAASSEAAHLIAMQNRLTDRTRKAKNESRRQQACLDAIAADLDKLAPLPDLERRLAEADDLEAALAALGRDIPALAGVLARGRTLRRSLAALAGSGRVLDGLAAPPLLGPTAALAEAIGRRLALARARERTAGRRTVLARLAGPPALADTAGLAEAVRNLGRLRLARRRGQVRESALSRLAGAPVLAETASLAAAIRRQEAVRTALAGLAATAVRLAGLAAPPDIADVRPLAELGRAIAAGRAALAAKASEVAAKVRALDLAQVRIAARLDELGACPLCGGRLSAARFLGLGRESGSQGEAS
jgi:exonuclease SbcC